MMQTLYGLRRHTARILVLLLLATVIGSALPPATPAVVASSHQQAASCYDLLAVKEWTITMSFSWSNSGRQDDATARAHRSGNIEATFTKYATYEDNATWELTAINGEATSDNYYEDQWSYSYHRANGSPHVRTNGSINSGYLTVMANLCAYNLVLPAWVQGEAARVSKGGWYEMRPLRALSMAGMLSLQHEPIQMPGNGELPFIHVRRSMPFGTYDGNDQFGGCCAVAEGFLDQWGYPRGNVDVFYTMQPTPYQKPSLRLEREFFDRSVFLNEVHIDHWFDSHVGWGEADRGQVTWQVGSRSPEQSGVTSAATVRKVEQLSVQGVGPKTVSAVAKNSDGAASKPESTLLWLAPLMSWCGGKDGVSGSKFAEAVVYRCGFKAPEPAFQAEAVPKWVPYFKDTPLGIDETQAALDIEIKSTGEGTVKGSGQTGFSAMGGKIYGSVAGKGDVRIDPDGVHIPSGTVELAIAGKLEKEESLFNAVPSLAATIESIRKFDAAMADRIESAAKLKLEIEPKFQVAINLESEGDKIIYKSDEASVSIGLKATLISELIKDVLQLRAGIGGEVGIVIQVPGKPDYLKQIDLKFVAFYQVQVWKFLEEGERAWTSTIAGSAPSAVEGARRESAAPSASTWRYMDRDYLLEPDYASWTGVATSHITPDQQLVQNINPLADHAFLSRYGTGYEYLVWAHDRPGAPIASSQELMFARGSGTGWATNPFQLTNDAFDDFNPQAVMLANGKILVLWQRMDSSSPGDLNTDPQAFFSHHQLAAGVFSPTATPPAMTPVQITGGGSINHRPQLGAVSNGALAVWVNNPTNRLLGSTSAPDTLKWAHYNYLTDRWSTSSLLVNVAGLQDFSLATQGDKAALVYTLDMDGSIATPDDSELFYVLGQKNGDGSWSWGSPVRRTNNSVPDSSPLLQLSDDGSPLLVWRQGADVHFLNGTWSATSQVPALDMDSSPINLRLARGKNGSLALVWQEQESYDTRIGYAVYDAPRRSWGKAQTIKPLIGSHTAEGNSAAVTKAEPVLVAGEGSRDYLVLAYQIAEVRPVTRTVEGISVPNLPELGKQHLRIAHLPLDPNLRIRPADLRVAPAAAGPGEQVNLSAVVRSTGGRAVPGVVVELVQQPLPSGSTVVLDSRTIDLIAAGTAQTVTFTLPHPARADLQHRVRVKAPSGVYESDSTDNEAILGMELSIDALPTRYSPGAAVLPVMLRPQSPLPSTSPVKVVLRREGVDGPILQELWASLPITPGLTTVVTTSLLASDLGPGSHQLFWQVDPAGALGETNLLDSWTTTRINVLPDLMSDSALVEFGRQPGTSAPIRIFVRNAGNQPSAPGSARIYTAPPDTSGARALGLLSLPAIPPGGIAEVNGTLNLGGGPEAGSGLRAVYVQLDPENAQPEINENNNGVLAGEPYGDRGSGVYTIYIPLLRR